MIFPVDLPLSLLADSSSAAGAMRAYIMPVVATLCGLASLACVFFIVTGGIQYMTSSGNPEKLENAKKMLKNALIGLALVIAAGTLTLILSHAYTGSNGAVGEGLPAIQQAALNEPDTGIGDVLFKAITGLLRKIAESVGKPFLEALGYFTNSTPLMGDNSSVFNLWLVVVGITDVLFILVVALLGFHVMSFSTFGFDELELKHLLPQLALVFLLINSSIFIIDGIIGLSNAMIHAVRAGFPDSSVWEPLIRIALKGPALGFGGLLILVILLVVSVMLLVYYVMRLVALYLGAVLAPLILLLWLIPAFKDFAVTALKIYLTTIFVLFVHVIILLLASSIFVGISKGDGQPNSIMGLIVGLATITALLKTQGLMQELSYAASGPKAAREVAGSFIKGVSYLNGVRKRRNNSPDDEKKPRDDRKDKDKKNSGVVPPSKLNWKKDPYVDERMSNKPLRTGETVKAAKPAARSKAKETKE